MAVAKPSAMIAAVSGPHPDLAFDWAVANKDKVNLATAGLGAVSQLCGLMLQQAIGVTMTEVPFQGTAPAMNDLLGGQIETRDHVGLVLGFGQARAQRCIVHADGASSEPNRKGDRDQEQAVREARRHAAQRGARRESRRRSPRRRG